MCCAMGPFSFELTAEMSLGSSKSPQRFHSFCSWSVLMDAGDGTAPLSQHTLGPSVSRLPDKRLQANPLPE